MALHGKDIGATLAQALKRVAAFDKPRFYSKCKKYLQDDYGLLIADSGHVWIPTGVRPEPDVYPGDIIIVYTVLDMLKTGDYVQVPKLTDIKDLPIEHVRVTKVSI
jgi:hypothetical protein